jgi:cytochrome c-type biogenesis protein CcmH
VLLDLKRRGVAIDAIAIRDRPEDVAAFLARHGDPFERIGSDDRSQVQIALGSSGVPESFVVDGRGIIRLSTSARSCRMMSPASCKRWRRQSEAAAARTRSSRGSRFCRQRLAALALGERAIADPAQEAAATKLMQEIRCLVCQGQAIGDSDAELAGDMRALVRERIGRGESPEEVRRWLIQRYGAWVSYRPPLDPLGWPLWAHRSACSPRAHGCSAAASGGARDGTPHPPDAARGDARLPVAVEAAGAAFHPCCGRSHDRRGRLCPSGPTVACGSPDDVSKRSPPVPLTAARKALLGQFTAADTWMTISEGYASRGKTADAVGVMNSAIRASPNDFAMWVGLGNALSDHARTLTPSAQFAFARAAELAPGHPAPPFFLGLAEARSGKPDQASNVGA